ncbi:TetR family transcriptional regulator [Methanocella arvoryzae]|uniref:Transcription regulator (TetR family) n=1 Tax=Methanocella arvoryzae (strain DSM 22066 / NBRC 105507 / MRE50) TaxID=351160 RepID=Q0W1E0_METAR|nr:TetR family transcriptional regulator [Methanocella arvoryzae]CAJ37803.1 putative transcription regulator (TetR family) [Methanocella arvoryzae MRE50]
MRRTKEEAEVTRDKLLSAALKVFSKKGYATTTLDDIAREAGVTRGAIYWHFKGGKADVFNAIVDTGFARIGDLVEKLMAEGGTPLELLERMMVRLMQFCEEDDDYRALQEITIFKMSEDPELSLKLEDKKHAQEESVLYIADLIKQAREAGEVRPDVDPMTAAITAYGMLNGIVLLWMIERSVTDTPQFSLKDQAASFVKLYLQGITTPAGCRSKV